MMGLTDIGLELWILVHHLYQEYGQRPGGLTTVLHELALRTSCICSEDDVEIAKMPSSLRDTQWFRKMSQRYSAMRQQMRDTYVDVIHEAESTTRSLYPAGCKLEDYADALLTCAALLSKPIASQTLSRFTEFRVGELTSQGCVRLTADELAHDLIEQPLMESILPPRWWEMDEKGDAAVSVKDVRLCSRPAHMLIVYRWCGRLRRRRILLAGVLHEKGSTTPLAKRLSRTHGALLKEEQFCVYLLRLQSFMRACGGSSETIDDRERESPTPLPPLPLQAPMQQREEQDWKPQHIPIAEPGETARESKPLTVAVNKADLGLLYRNPEAALENVDLNDADDITLQEFKEMMDEKFIKNVIRPGDPGYVYDKRVEVRPTERSEWDDSD